MNQRISSLVRLAATLALFAACNPFRSPFKQDPVVEVKPGDVSANNIWNGTLSSPASLAGAVQMSGAVTMMPGKNNQITTVTVNLSNASPGGVHPWQVRQGQCGSDYGVFGSADSYKALEVDDQGRASSTANVSMTMPHSGQYFVSVSASAANAQTIVACGNLAAPSR